MCIIINNINLGLHNVLYIKVEIPAKMEEGNVSFCTIDTWAGQKDIKLFFYIYFFNKQLFLLTSGVKTNFWVINSNNHMLFLIYSCLADAQIGLPYT